MKTEIWKPFPIEEFKDDYQVSTLGQVRSLNYSRTGKTKILKPLKLNNGYLKVDLYKNGKFKQFCLHRLVAEAFIPNLLEEPQVNHINEDKTDNRVENLEWCSASYNINHGTRNKRSAEKLTNGKLSKPVLQLTKAGELVREWPSVSEAGRNGFNKGSIVSCCRGDRKSHKGYIWSYK